MKHRSGERSHRDCTAPTRADIALTCLRCKAPLPNCIMAERKLRAPYGRKPALIVVTDRFAVTVSSLLPCRFLPIEGSLAIAEECFG
jgi:hypothetical protein